MKKITIYSLILIVIDQLIKILINTLKLNSSIVLINNFFNITYVRNYGAAFSILQNSRLLLIIIAVISLFVIYRYIKKDNINKIKIITYSLLIGGLIGNLIDRIVRGYVIDYLDFTIFNYPFPIFNFADICIVVSVILILILEIEEKHANKSR